MAGRGWAWTAYDWDEGRLFNYIGDAQNTFPVWNATPLVALDVYEHAYFIDFGTDRGGVHRRVLRQPRLRRRERLGAAVRHPQVAVPCAGGDLRGPRSPGLPPRLVPVGLLARAARPHEDIRKVGSRQHRRDERLAHLRPLARPAGRAARRAEGLRPGARSGCCSSRRTIWRHPRRRRPRCSGTGGRCSSLREGRQDGGDLRRRLLRRRRLGRADGRGASGSSSSCVFRYASVASIVAGHRASGLRRGATGTRVR